MVEQSHLWLDHQSGENRGKFRFVPSSWMIVLQCLGFLGLLVRIQPDKPGSFCLDGTRHKRGAAAPRRGDQHKQPDGEKTADFETPLAYLHGGALYMEWTTPATTEFGIGRLHTPRNVKLVVAPRCSITGIRLS